MKGSAPLGSPLTANLAMVASCCLGLAVPLDAEDAINECAFDRDTMLQLDQRTFDQDFSNGWREVASRPGCKEAAAELIREYRVANNPDSSILYWHEGQLRAMIGATSRAVELFRQSRKDPKLDRIGWNHYVDATIAFLLGNRERLRRARERLAATPEPDNFSPVDSFGNPVDLRWPPNLNVVDGLISCFGKSYDTAYSECSTSLIDDD